MFGDRVVKCEELFVSVSRVVLKINRVVVCFTNLKGDAVYHHLKASTTRMKQLNLVKIVARAERTT